MAISSFVGVRRFSKVGSAAFAAELESVLIDVRVIFNSDVGCLVDVFAVLLRRL